MRKFAKENFPIIIILILAIILRFWSIDFGLPQIQIGDEGALVTAALYSGANMLKPFRPMYGQLVPYLLLIEYTLYFIAGFLSGKFSTPFDVLISFIKDPRDLLLIGRLTMMCVGVMTIYLTYMAGKQFYTKRIGLFAAFFLAISFLHVKESHYLKEGNIAAFFTLACFYFTLKILQRGDKRDYFAAGITLGLGLGTKYEPILMVPIVAIAHLLHHKQFTLKHVKYFLLGFIPCLVLTFPYLFQNPFQYYQTFIAEYKLTTTVYPLYLQGKPVWWWFLNVHIPQGLGFVLFATAIGGFILSLRKSKSKLEYLLIPILPLIFLMTIDYWQKFHNARYALLVLPFYTLGAAVFLDWICGFIRKKWLNTTFMLVALLFLGLPSLIRVIQFNTIIVKSDTRTISKNWIETHIPAGSRILVESMVRSEYPANINVSLILDRSSIDRYITEANLSGYPGTYLIALKTATSGQVGYDLVATTRIDFAKDLVTGISKELTSAQYWDEQNIEYIIITNWVQRSDMKTEFNTSLGEYYTLIKEFRPNPQFGQDPHFMQMDYSVLDSIDIFNKYLLFGPAIQIYKQKNIRT